LYKRGVGGKKGKKKKRCTSSTGKARYRQQTVFTVTTPARCIKKKNNATQG